MHSMVGAFNSYTGKPRRVEIVRGYCYRFFQCSYPCGVVMLILSVIFIIIGASQLIYIMYFNGCNTLTTSTIDRHLYDDLSVASSSSSSSFKCNRQTMRVLGITFAVTGSVLFLISLLITKYSGSSEESNVIRTTVSSLSTNNIQNQHHRSSAHHHRTPSSSLNEQNNFIVSIR